jgi:nucleotide-binding universal stress UspA family protein
MTNCVLVPLDGSDKDSRAISAAAAMVELTGCDARVLRIFEPPTGELSERTLTMGGLHAAQKRLAEVSLALTDATNRLGKVTGKPAIAEVAEASDIGEMLVDRASRPETAVVVMATRAAVGPDRAFFGSVADHVMRESRRPILLVPPLAGRQREGDRLRLRRVLVPLDGSRLRLAALEHLLALDHERQLEYVLLEVVPLMTPPHGLEDVADRLRRERAHAVEVHILPDIEPAAAIVRVARTERVDFIAMSSRGLHGVDRLVRGSVAESVIRDGNLPVFVVTESSP